MSFIFIDKLDPVEAVAPFLAILEAQNMAGPFKMASLSAIQTFLDGNALLAENSESSDRTREAIGQVVDSVTK